MKSLYGFFHFQLISCYLEKSEFKDSVVLKRPKFLIYLRNGTTKIFDPWIDIEMDDDGIFRCCGIKFSIEYVKRLSESKSYLPLSLPCLI